MILNFGSKLRINSDERQYILQELKKVNRTNPETNNKETVLEWQNKGYYGGLKWALRAIPDKLLKKNEDIEYIKEQLDNIYNSIDKFEQAYIEDIKCLKNDKQQLEEEILELKNQIKELNK